MGTRLHWGPMTEPSLHPPWGGMLVTGTSHSYLSAYPSPLTVACFCEDSAPGILGSLLWRKRPSSNHFHQKWEKGQPTGMSSFPSCSECGCGPREIPR